MPMSNINTQLKKVPLFSSVSDEALEMLANKLEEVHFAPGETIIREGDLGDCFYIIQSGKVRIETQIEEMQHPVILARLEAGDYFGEMALITGEPRSATVVAEEDVTLWRLWKKDFDSLIMNNPQITVSLTHMLSHRLMQTNKTLEQTELQFLKKIHPSGNLKDFSLIRILSFAEQNALTGKVVLRNGEKEAIFEFEKGQLQKLVYGDLEEDEALDELLTWQEGQFLIQPTFWEAVDQSLHPNPARNAQQQAECQALENYFKEKLREFVQFAGSRSTQMALNKSVHRLRSVFDFEDVFVLQTQPHVRVDFSRLENFGEKHVLVLAVLLNHLFRYLEKEVVGMEFWDVRSKDEKINEILQEKNFFTFFEHAAELV